MQTLGEYLRQKRQERKFGMRQLARKLSYDPSSLSKIEHGRLEPSADFLTAVIKHLKLSQQEGDELFELAGRLPPDLKALALQRKGIFRLLRENVPHAESESGAFIAIGTTIGKQ